MLKQAEGYIVSNASVAGLLSAPGSAACNVRKLTPDTRDQHQRSESLISCSTRLPGHKSASNSLLRGLLQVFMS